VPGASPRGNGGCVGLTTLPPSFDECLEILVVSTSWSPYGLPSSIVGYLILAALGKEVLKGFETSK
jgi:hypothetical protein